MPRPLSPLMLAMLLGATGLGLGGAARVGLAADEPKAEDAASETSDGQKSGDPQTQGISALNFVRIQPIIVPVVGKNGAVEQLVTVIVQLEVFRARDVSKLESVAPRLTDAFVTDLYGALDRRKVLRDNLIDIPILKERLLAAAERVIGPDIVKQVLVQTITQRQMVRTAR